MGILFQSCWKDKTLRDKNFNDIKVSISPSYGVPLVNLKIRGDDVVRRINRDSATNSFFVEYDENDYDLCVIVYDKTNIFIPLLPNFTAFDMVVEYSLDFFGDLRKDGWTPMVAHAMLYVDNDYTTGFKLNIKKLDYEDFYGRIKSVVTAGSLPKTGFVAAATESGTFKRSLAIDKLVVNDPIDIVFKGREASLSFELTSDNPLSDSGRLNLNPIIKIPAHIIMNNFVRRDTVSVSLKEILKYAEDDVVSIEKVTFYLKLVNSQPLDAKMQIYFADANYRILDSIYDEEIVVKSGIIDTYTYLIQSATTTEEAINMTKEKLKKVRNTKFLIIRETFTSGNSADVKLFKSNYIDVILSAKVDTKIKGTISEIK